MTITTNKNIRFCDNNFAELISSSIEYSSQLSSFPFSNAINKFRSKLWKPSGNFTIDATNNLIYINDGTNKIATLTVANYSTPALLAAHIQTKLNAVSSLWTCSYDTLSGDYRFYIAHTGSATLRLSQTTNASWNTIGFTSTTDQVGTTFLANEQRNHTSEYCIFDMGYPADISFFGCIGPLQSAFPISGDATITLKANNLNQWDTVPLNISLSSAEAGIFHFLDDIDDNRFRYWKFEFNDRKNSGGPTAISIGHIYAGDYITLNRNVANSMAKQLYDPSVEKESENGAIYYDVKTKYSMFTGLNLEYLERSDKDLMEDLFNRLGIYTPFYVSLDPTLTISDEIGEFTKYVTFKGTPNFNHVIFDKFSMSLELREQV